MSIYIYNYIRGYPTRGSPPPWGLGGNVLWNMNTGRIFLYDSQNGKWAWRLENVNLDIKVILKWIYVWTRIFWLRTASYPIIGLDGPSGLQEVEAPRISRKSTYEGGKVVSPTHRSPLPAGYIPGSHFCKRLSRPQGHSAAGRIMSIKNFNDFAKNRIRYQKKKGRRNLLPAERLWALQDWRVKKGCLCE